MSTNHSPTSPCHYVDPQEVESFRTCTHIVRFITTAVHELVGHGAGKLLSESAPGQFNFDSSNPPLNPLTNEPIRSWYRPGQTWTSVFQDIAPSVEECRATLISEYLMDSKELLSIFGYDENSSVTADDRQ